jgi:hypothetical protein
VHLPDGCGCNHHAAISTAVLAFVGQAAGRELKLMAFLTKRDFQYFYYWVAIAPSPTKNFGLAALILLHLAVSKQISQV